MKKIKNLLFTVVICLLMIPMIVSADMGAPMTTSYDVVITNPNGVEIGYGSKKVVIPYDTRVTVNYEYENDGELYGSVTYNDVYGEIKISDTKMYETKVDFSKVHKLDKKIELYIFDDGAYLYNGPSKAYGKVDGNVQIPKGKTVSYQYYDEMWSYVEYNGTKGWLYTYSFGKYYSDLKNVAAHISTAENKIYILENISTIKASPSYDAKDITVNIKKDTELTYDYYIPSGRSRYVHLKTNDFEGWLSVTFDSFDGFAGSAIAQESCSSGLVMEDLAIYPNYDPSTISSENIPKGAEVKLVYSFRDEDRIWNKVEYKNKEVWVSVPADDYRSQLPIAYDNGYYTTYKAKNNVTIYESPDASSKQLGTISTGETVKTTYSYYLDTGWYYVVDKDVKGWVPSNDLSYESAKEMDKCTKPISNPVDDDEDPNEDKPSDAKKEDKKEQMSLLTAALIAVGIAVAIGITVVVIVVLVNKKNKSKK